MIGLKFRLLQNYIKNSGKAMKITFESVLMNIFGFHFRFAYLIA